MALLEKALACRRILLPGFGKNLNEIMQFVCRFAGTRPAIALNLRHRCPSQPRQKTSPPADDLMGIKKKETGFSISFLPSPCLPAAIFLYLATRPVWQNRLNRNTYIIQQ